jgi:hypothetical protein
MPNPNLQNDFSFYRRSLGRIRANPEVIIPFRHEGIYLSNTNQNEIQQANIVVLKEDLTNRISFFLAQATPMSKVLLDTLHRLVEKVFSHEIIILCFSQIMIATTPNNRAKLRKRI